MQELDPMDDPIVEELHRIREARAARFNYDMKAMFEDLKAQERASGRTFAAPPVRLPPTDVAPAGAVTSAS